MEVIEEKKNKKSGITIVRPTTLDGVYIITQGDITRAEEDRVQQVASYWSCPEFSFFAPIPDEGMLYSGLCYGTSMMHRSCNPTDDELLAVIPRRCARVSVVKLRIDPNGDGAVWGDGYFLSPARVYFVVGDKNATAVEMQQVARFTCLDDEELMKRVAHISGVVTSKSVTVAGKSEVRLVLHKCPQFSTAGELHKFDTYWKMNDGMGQLVEVVCTSKLNDSTVVRVPMALGEQREVIGTKVMTTHLVSRTNAQMDTLFCPHLCELLSQLPHQLFEGDSSRYIINTSMITEDHCRKVLGEHIVVATIWKTNQ